MSGASSIEWTDATWNPVRGCTRVSEGCRHCYAETLAARNLPGHRSPTTGKPFAERTLAGPRWTGKVELIPHLLDWPLRRKKPLRIFVNSMSDLFHESLPFEAIAAVFGVMALANDHTFQVLTKRPSRAVEFLSWMNDAERVVDRAAALRAIATAARLVGNWGAFVDNYAARSTWPLPNVWLGVSVENQQTADKRIPLLLRAPAAKRFVSYEPALGPVDFERAEEGCLFGWYTHWRQVSENEQEPEQVQCDSLDWIIVGGESGPGARPFDVSWARSTVEQCRTAGVACFVKQMGSQPTIAADDVKTWPSQVPPHVGIEVSSYSGPDGLRFRDRKGGDPSEWPEDLRVQEFPLP